MQWALAAILSVPLLLGVVPARAETSPQPYPDFTFKRLGPPEAGSRRRITVQIDPEEQARMLASVMFPPAAAPDVPGAELPAPPAATGSYDWYWSIVPPGIAPPPGRFETALAALDHDPAGGSVRAPRLQAMHAIAQAHGRDILATTAGTAVSPALVLAVIAVESSGRADAVSSAGAVGLMQLIPATAERFDVADSTIPSQNIRGGVAYLDWLMREFGSDPVLVLAAYNAGENAVKTHGGVPPYAETRGYVPKVLAAWRVARGLCLSPPELVSDGCVFTSGSL